MKFRKCKCYFCNEYIEYEEDRVKFNISEKTTKNFHVKCLPLFKLKKKEWEKWNELYDYVRFQIMDYSKDTQLTPNMRNKLQSLRSGEFIIKGKKILEEGYDYDVILMTFKAKKNEIANSIFGKVFTDENHKFNYIMVIIKNSINDVKRRVENAKKLKERENNTLELIKNIKSETEQIEDFKKVQKKKRKKDDISKLFNI